MQNKAKRRNAKGLFVVVVAINRISISTSFVIVIYVV